MRLAGCAKMGLRGSPPSGEAQEPLRSWHYRRLALSFRGLCAPLLGIGAPPQNRLARFSAHLAPRTSWARAAPVSCPQRFASCYDQPSGLSRSI